jgi:hypothetical protein
LEGELMADVGYPFSIQDDFPNHMVNTTLLRQQVFDSAISSAVYSYHVTNGDEIELFFDAELSSGDEDLLNAIVAAHTGVSSSDQNQLAESEVELEATVADSWVDKLVLTPPALAIGTWLVTWYCEIKLDKGVPAGIVKGRVLLDDTEKAADSWQIEEWHAFGGSLIVNTEEGATPETKIQFAFSGSGDSGWIRRAVLTMTLLDKPS